MLQYCSFFFVIIMSIPSPKQQMGEQKFRPYFTSSELLYLIALCKNAPSPRIPLISYLEEFAIKIERGIKTPAITNDPSIESKLGFVDSSPAPGIHMETIVNMWEMFPNDRKQYSPAQLSQIAEFRYLNDRMSPVEEAEYEKQSAQSAQCELSKSVLK